MSLNGHDAPGGGGSLAPEHDWAAASESIFPALRPSGTHGAPLAELDDARLAHEGTKTHALPLVDDGPADLMIVYVLRQPAYDVVVNADHLLTWGVGAEALRSKAMDNLRAWSNDAPWSGELEGKRHLVSSDTGDGGDAARILLPEVRSHLAGECGGPARVLVGLPDRDLLVAGSLNPGDAAFAEQFAAFVSDISEGASEPIEGMLFEIVGDDHKLVPYGR
ncbi:MAG TPA: hypothetical protein VJ850_12820 [Candidatus Limnocylindrales bacterium]|nr:hypothetical protein [Candidatus Limnocylindrales bacterium]